MLFRSLGFRKISESYAGRDVLFLGIVPGNFYSEIEAEQFKVKYSVPFEIYIDKSMLLTDYLKATVTPEVFLLDASGQIIYSGKIDDWAAATGVHKQVITHNYLTDALDSFLKNEPVKLKHTQAVGCFIE